MRKTATRISTTGIVKLYAPSVRGSVIGEPVDMAVDRGVANPAGDGDGNSEFGGEQDERNRRCVAAPKALEDSKEEEI